MQFERSSDVTSGNSWKRKRQRSNTTIEPSFRFPPPPPYSFPRTAFLSALYGALHHYVVSSIRGGGGEGERRRVWLVIPPHLVFSLNHTRLKKYAARGSRKNNIARSKKKERERSPRFTEMSRVHDHGSMRYPCNVLLSFLSVGVYIYTPAFHFVVGPLGFPAILFLCPQHGNINVGHCPSSLSRHSSINDLGDRPKPAPSRQYQDHQRGIQLTLSQRAPS